MPRPSYWDASAILSVLVEDRHSPTARRHLTQEGPHLVSSLAFTEVCAVLTRLAKERHLTARERRLAIASLQARPWSVLNLEPDRRLAADLALRHSLRGADLWHLSSAATLAAELPGLVLLTFDTHLAAAARRERLVTIRSSS